MPKTINTPLLSLSLDRKSETSLQGQIYQQLRDAILAGRLGPGTGLPASRSMARPTAQRSPRVRYPSRINAGARCKGAGSQPLGAKLYRVPWGP